MAMCYTSAPMRPAVTVETEFTPNPHSLKFNVNCALRDSGSAYFQTKEAAGKSSPLAAKLFGVPHVEGVLIGQRFVTITRDNSLETWASVIPAATKVLREHLESGEPVMLPGAPEPSTEATGSEIERKIKQILNDRIRPAVAQDGGDIIFHGFKNGVVTLHLQGSCSSCPSSSATLKAGVERMLREYVPEVKEVVQV